MERIKKQVKDLQVGDNLGSCTIIANPVNIGDYMGQKNRVQINVRYSNGKESTRIWGKYTTVTVNA